MALRLSMLVLLGLAACDGDDSTTDGATTLDTGIAFDAAGLDVAPPAPPADAIITPCPEGWAEVMGEVTTCSPWPLAEPPSCAAHEARFVGDGACARVGSACPADGWPTDLPADGTVRYVRAGAAGTGTRAAPFGTITDALVGAEPGSTIAVAVGSYEEAVDVPGEITLRGACAEGTILSSAAPAIDAGVVTVFGAGVGVRDLTIRASQRGGIFIVGADRSATVRDVVIEDVRAVGIDVEHGGSLDAENVSIRRVSSTVTGAFGRGVSVENAGNAALRRVNVEEATEFGILSIEAIVTLEDVWVARTDALPDGSAGPGIVAWRTGSVTGRRVVVDAGTDVGIAANEGVVDLELALVRGTQTRPAERDHGRGINVEAGSVIECSRCVLEDNNEFGFVVDGVGSIGTFEDLVVRGTRSILDGVFGRAITVQNGGEIEVTRALLVDNGESGALAGGPVASTATLRDLTIRDVRASGRTAMGRGLSVQNGSQMTVERALLEDLLESGVVATDPGSTVTLRDLLLRNVEPVDALLPGGRGILGQLGAALVLERVAVHDVHDLGVAAYREGSSLTATDLTVEGVVELTCDTGLFCEDAPGGHGAAAYLDGHVTLTDFRIANAQLCGVHAAGDGTLLLTRGIVSGSAIGACVQSPAQDLDDLRDEVRYQDNVRALDSTDLPVPEAVGRPMDAT